MRVNLKAVIFVPKIINYYYFHSPGTHEPCKPFGTRRGKTMRASGSFSKFSASKITKSVEKRSRKQGNLIQMYRLIVFQQL